MRSKLFSLLLLIIAAPVVAGAQTETRTSTDMFGNINKETRQNGTLIERSVTRKLPGGGEETTYYDGSGVIKGHGNSSTNAMGTRSTTYRDNTGAITGSSTQTSSNGGLSRTETYNGNGVQTGHSATATSSSGNKTTTYFDASGHRTGESNSIKGPSKTRTTHYRR